MPADNMPSEEDALNAIVDCIRNPRPDGYSKYGYEFYMPGAILTFIQEVEGSTEHPSHIYGGQRMRQLSPVFYDAAWSLCRRGILRPSIRRHGDQATDDGSGGNGYCVTEMGRRWLQVQDSIPLAPTRLTRLFEGFTTRYGSGFIQRAAEAVTCHQFGNYLAACVMCGAASESILLAVAVAKTGDEEAVLTAYRSANGRKKIVDSIIGQARPALAEHFRNATGLLSYWRDEAAHGILSEISEIEAHEALARLVRFAQFSQDNWTALTGAA
jgi:hypothetical protein